MLVVDRICPLSVGSKGPFSIADPSQAVAGLPVA